MRLIANWRKAPRMFSVQALAVIAALPAAWLAIPDEAKAMIPAQWVPWISTGLAVAGLIGRLVDQGTAEDRE